MMKMKKLLAAMLMLVLVAVSLCGCGSNAKRPVKYNSKYKVCMITDCGDITDQSFNQMTYEAARDYCAKHKLDFTYKKPDGDTNYARIAMVDVAVAEGYNILVMPGFDFARTVVETTKKYPEVKFIALDMSAGDIGAAAVGNKYYAQPEQYNPRDYYNTDNTYLAVYQEQIGGYLAGYAATKLGYKKLGYLGGQAVPAVMRYGYGFVQGIDAAAKEMGIADQVQVEYAYGGQFFGSIEITAAMDTWFAEGTQIVFPAGGLIWTSAAEAAAKVNGKLLGCDSDQAPIIDKYGKGMTVTSPLKKLDATVNAMLDAITVNNTWQKHVGKVENLGLVSGTDLNLNYIGLPEKSTQWNKNFTVDDYRRLVKKIYEGKIKISSDVTAPPKTAVKVNYRQGTIK